MMTMESRSVFASLALLLVITLGLSGCGPEDPQSSNKGNSGLHVEKSVSPTSSPSPCSDAVVRVVILQDKTGSTSSTRTPQISEQQINQLIDFIRPCGGEIAFGLVNENSNASLRRLRIEVPPTGAPVDPGREGNPIVVRREQAAYRAAKEQYVRLVQQWNEESERRVTAFMNEIRPVLGLPATARASDFFGGVQRANLFFSESDIVWPSPPRKYLVIIGDGIDNVRKRREPLSAGAQLLLVNGSASIGSLAELNPKPFENIDSALRFIVASEGRGVTGH